MILTETSEKFHISIKDTVTFLKKNPNKIPFLESSWNNINRIQNIENLNIKGVTPEIFERSVGIAKTNMLLSHDALHLTVMQSMGLSDIATNDNDFERIEGITVWKP